MKIAYFNASLNEQQDGVSRCVYRMIAGALERGHEVIAVSSACPEGEGPVRMVGVPSVVLPMQRGYRLAVPGYCHFTQPLQDFAPDLIHSNSPCTLGFAAIGYARRFGLPVVSTYHTHFPSYVRYYNMRGFEEVAWSIMRAHYNGMDRTFVPTMPILDELAAHGIRRVQYMPNGYDSALFNPAARSAEWRQRFGGGDIPILLFLSRLVWEKDLRVLAETYRALRNQECRFEMVVVGDGPAREELARLMPGAHFLGHLSGRALSEAFASSDIFVFPSTTETFGLVTLEAMASGLAPVAADAGGASELIAHGVSGMLVPPRDPVALASEVRLLIDHPALRHALAIKAMERSRAYAWDAVLDRLFAGYEEIIAQPRSRRRCRVLRAAA